VGVFSIIAILGLSASSPSSASILTSSADTSVNSQRLSLLRPNYSIEIPQAIGGPDEIRVNNKLALLSPQVGIGQDNVTQRIIKEDEDGMVIYVVQEGDSLSEIGELFDVSVNTIKWENKIGNTIKIGQELRILPITGVRHTVQKGDTFGTIAAKYDVEIEDITIFNDIDSTKLTLGNKILVPNGVKKSAVSTSAAKYTSKVSSSRSRSSGYYIRPTTGTTTSTFGPRKGTYHYGIDYGAATGTPIVATADGFVIKTSCGSGYGICLVIQHPNGTQSLYAHASRLYVNQGTRVVQGQKIAAVGSTGRSTGPHLHFEIIESSGKKRNVNFLK